MIVRIVSMYFKEDTITDFKILFDFHKNAIRNQPGCTYLELYQDLEDITHFYTYSYWDNEDSLNNYRKSDLFATVWPETKKLFSKKPEARSVTKIHSLL